MLIGMAISPTVEGFRATFRRPSLTLAEIMWRWTAGAIAAALLLFGVVEYLGTLPITNGELLFLRTRQPYLVGEAIAHILRGSLNRAMMAGMVAAFLLGMLWIVAASVGRFSTVRALLDYFRRNGASGVLPGGVRNDGGRDVASNVSPKALLRLNFLRAAVALAAVFGFLGAAILAGFASPDTDPQPALAFFLFLPLAVLVWLVWGALNWLLSLAGMFAVRDGEDAVGAISAALALCRERTGPVAAVSFWTGLAHAVAIVGAAIVASVPLGFAALVPWRLVALAMLLVTLAYFALADWLYMARLAGYVCVAEMPEPELGALPPAPRPVPPPIAAPPVQTTIDRDERILSDVPNLAAET